MSFVLTRREQEAFWIGNSRVLVSRIGGRAKIVVDAPDHVEIVREELLAPEEVESRLEAIERTRNEVSR